MKLKGSEAIIELLKQQGAGVVFGYPGAANAPIYRALAGSGIRHVLVRNEQGAAHSASGYAGLRKRWAFALLPAAPAQPI